MHSISDPKKLAISEKLALSFLGQKNCTSQFSHSFLIQKNGEKMKSHEGENFKFYFILGKSMKFLHLYFVLINMLQILSNQSHLFLSYSTKKSAINSRFDRILKDKIKQ